MYFARIVQQPFERLTSSQVYEIVQQKGKIVEQK